MFLISTGLLITIIILSVLLLIFLFVILPPFIIANYVFNKHLVRKSKDEWNRECSAKDNEEQVRMFDLGIEWAKENKDYLNDIEIENDGLKLKGQYFDFGFNRCAIILQGRTESLYYSYYFAKPYKESGFNILVIDSRAHGLSEGKYNTVGYKEYRDVLKWTDLIINKYNVNKFIVHGICIGSATGLKAIINSNDDRFIAMIADGMYINFYETFKNHMIEDKRPVHPFIEFIVLIMKIRCGVNIKKNGPEKDILKLNKPILFLYSKEDKFSLPDKAQYLYDICKSDNKKIVWFLHGAHSHIRINNQETYDNAIKEFINELE